MHTRYDIRFILRALLALPIPTVAEVSRADAERIHIFESGLRPATSCRRAVALAEGWAPVLSYHLDVPAAPAVTEPELDQKIGVYRFVREDDAELSFEFVRSYDGAVGTLILRRSRGTAEAVKVRP